MALLWDDENRSWFFSRYSREKVARLRRWAELKLNQKRGKGRIAVERCGRNRINSSWLSGNRLVEQRLNTGCIS